MVNEIQSHAVDAQVVASSLDVDLKVGLTTSQVVDRQLRFGRNLLSTGSAFDGFFRNRFLWVAVFVVVSLQLLAAYFSPLAAILGTVKPEWIDWVVVCSASLLTVGIVEIAKLILRWKRSLRQTEEISAQQEPFSATSLGSPTGMGLLRKAQALLAGR